MRCTKPWKGSIPSSDFTAVFCVVESFLFRSFPGGLKPRKSFKTTINTQKTPKSWSKRAQTPCVNTPTIVQNRSEPFLGGSFGGKVKQSAAQSAAQSGNQPHVTESKRIILTILTGSNFHISSEKFSTCKVRPSALAATVGACKSSKSKRSVQ